MQTLIDGAVIVQGNLEATGRLASRPGVIPIPVKEVWLTGNPFEPLSPYADYNAYTHVWTPRIPQVLVKDQTIPAKPTTAGFGGAIGGFALDPTQDPYIPGKN